MEQKKIKFLFFIYLFLIFNFIVLKFFGNLGDVVNRIKDRIILIKSGYWHIQLIPLETIRPTIKLISSDIGGPAMFNLIANTILFIPMGLLIPLLLSKPNFIKILGTSLGLTLGIELLQFITLLGVADVDDVLVNTLGAITGYILYIILKKVVYKTHFRNYRNTKWGE